MRAVKEGRWRLVCLMLIAAAIAGALGSAAACGSSGLPSRETASDAATKSESAPDGGGDDALLGSDPCAFPASGSAPPTTVDAFLAALRDAQCARMARCGLIEPSDLPACPAAIDYTTGGDTGTLASMLHARPPTAA